MSSQQVDAPGDTQPSGSSTQQAPSQDVRSAMSSMGSGDTQLDEEAAHGAEQPESSAGQPESST
eukprot:9470549-Pyramimonas_sp.AAC.1